MTVDVKTVEYYRQNADAVAARYEAVNSPVASFFPLAFPAGSRILDIGSGSGRDLATLLKAGYDAFGVEPVLELRQEAARRHPELADRVRASALPELATEASEAFDGVLCSAVIKHIPQQQLFDAAYKLTTSPTIPRSSLAVP